MSLFSLHPTLSLLLLRRHVHTSTSHFLSPPPPPILPHRHRHRHHFLYPSPRATTASPSLLIPRFSVSSGALLQDAGATAAVLAGAYGLVLTFDTLTQRNIIQQTLSRKLVHILSGLLFAVSWPIFSNSVEARYFASIVPLVNCLRLVINGLTLATDEGLIKSVTREGNPKELLRGPLYYVLVLIFCALVFWRESPVGVMALAMMCGGDGVADIMGRRFGSAKLPHNHQKSWAGSISMFISGFLISIGYVLVWTFIVTSLNWWSFFMILINI
eukprot:XP_015583143.1 probable phytol kinase 1, chloroplastic isoform X1 [Ricinus communis]